MSKDQEEFKKQSYFRLLKYVAPYKFRLSVGIIAGFIVGGSLFGSLMMVTPIVSGVDNSSSSKKGISTPQQVDAIIKVAESKDFKTEEAKAEAVRKLVNPGGEQKVVKELKSLKGFCESTGLPVKIENEKITWNAWPSFSIPSENIDGNMSWQFFSIYIIAFVVAWILKNIATYVNRYFTRWVGTKVITDLRNEVFRKLMGQSMKFYGKMDVGHLISRCTNDTASIESAVANSIADATRCPLEILACLAMIVWTSVNSHNYSLLVILFVGLPFCILPVVLLGKPIRTIYKGAFKKIAEVVSRMHEVFTGILIVKANHMEEWETNKFRDVNRKYFRTVVRALKLQMLMAPLMEVVAVTATLVFLIYTYSHGVSLSDLAGLLVPAFMAYRPIKTLAKVSVYMQRSMAAADRYFDLLDTDTSIKEKENAVDLKNFEDRVSFNNVVFSYDDGKKILDEVSFAIKKGEVVAVVGETGSGKTTIANLIARFYDVDSGSVTIDNMDVRDLKTASLRDHIGIVSQDAILFNDSIAHNISYGCEATREQIIEAAKLANAHQFIVNGSHKDGYDTIVGEKGFKLSGGEKQRVAIARAILKNPEILILDEATSALDTVTERLVQEALNHAMENRTVFAIAHRLSTIQHADMIIVLDKGKIIERGTHQELLNKGGAYKKLHDTQFGQN